MANYHTLLVRDHAAAPWCIEFGAYTKADVTAERDDYCDKGTRRADTMIVVTGPKQADINARVEYLNGKR